MIPLPYKIAAFIVAMVVAFAAGHSAGMEKYHEYRAHVEQEMELVRIENEQKLAAMATVAQDATQRWEAARDALGRNPVIRVQPHRCEGILPTPTAPSQGTDANAETRTIDPAQCEAYLNQGIEDAAQLMHLQQFLIDQHEASK